MAKSIVAISNCLANLSKVGQWNMNIRKAVNEGHSRKALIMFLQMKQKGLEPNNLTFPFVAKACGKLSNLKYSQIIHAHVAKSSFQLDKYVQTSLVDMYVKCNHIDDAYDVFDRMPQRDLASWNAMVLGFGQLGLLDRTLAMFSQMRLDGIQPDSVTVIGLSQLGSSRNDLKFVNVVHSFGIQIGIDSDVSIANTFISAYSKCGDLGSAEQIFDGIDSDYLTVISWNSMISGCAYIERSLKAISFYSQMLYNGFRPDISTILNLLSSCVRPEALCEGKLIHSHGIQVGCDLDITVLNTTISMYSKCGDISSARLLFDAMNDKTCVSWTCMIGGYAKNGNLDEAFTLFHLMEAEKRKPDLVTMLHLISVCGQMGAVEIGRSIDNYATLNGLKSNILVSNALLDMYAKCGSMRDARTLFGTIYEKTIVSWTSMIAGCALNGEFEEALGNFFHILELGLKPNHITFLAVLQACNHAGFLERGLELFTLMTEKYKLNPWLEHYSCIADLLGRKGKLKEALCFIQNMAIKPDAGIWGSLLGACKIHCNVEIGEYAAQRLFELEPQTAAPYVEIANIYASAGRWDGVAAIRTLMKCNQVTKSPGQSTVQVDGKFHTFTVEDRYHSEGLLIYEALDGLALHLKEELNSSFLEQYMFLP